MISNSTESRILDFKGEIPSPRAGCSAIYQKFGVMFGGASHEDGFSNQLYRFDIVNDSINFVLLDNEKSPTARYEQFTCFIDNSELLVMYWLNLLKNEFLVD